MAAKKMTERLALPMFVCGIIAMVSSAGVSLGASATATSPVEYEKVTMTYLSSGYSASDSTCGSTSNVYYGSSKYSSFRSKNLRTSGNDQAFLCTATFYVVTNVNIPTPKPIPTITVIQSPQQSATPRPTRTIYVTPTATPRPTYEPRPTKSPRPTPTATRSPRPTPSYFQSPTPKPSLFIPAPTPTKSPKK
jgi:hypothetical protein